VNEIARKPPLYPHIPKSKAASSLPVKDEMLELDELFRKANNILMRWRFKMSRHERIEFPSTFKAIDDAENALLKVSNCLEVISREIGLGPFKEANKRNKEGGLS